MLSRFFGVADLDCRANFQLPSGFEGFQKWSEWKLIKEWVRESCVCLSNETLSLSFGIERGGEFPCTTSEPITEESDLQRSSVTNTIELGAMEVGA
jgi:hypothetical protein